MKAPRQRRSGSNSDAQRGAEAIALRQIAVALEVPELHGNHKIAVGGGSVSVDGFWESETQVVMVEVNARVGRMKTATLNKVMKDAFKMLVVSKLRAEAWHGKQVRCALVFVDEEARASFGPKSWGHAAFNAMGIESHVCQVTSVERLALQAAQRRQDLLFNG